MTATVLTDTPISGNISSSHPAIRGDELTCNGSDSVTAGFLQNIGVGDTDAGSPAVWAATSLVSNGCDFGTGADDNTGGDVGVPDGATYTYGDDATFSCDTAGCY
jgi:hypothetical protein